jgi:hypothetical protein
MKICIKADIKIMNVLKNSILLTIFVKVTSMIWLVLFQGCGSGSELFWEAGSVLLKSLIRIRITVKIQGLQRLKMEPRRVVEAHNRGVEAQNRSRIWCADSLRNRIRGSGSAN